MMKSILLVDHDQDAMNALRQSLEAEKFQVETTGTSLDALTKIRNEQNIGCILVDESMPRMSGIELASHLKHCSQTPVILMTQADDFDPNLIFRVNVSGVMKKPINAMDVINFLKANDLHLAEKDLGRRKLLRKKAKLSIILVKLFDGVHTVTGRLDNVSPGGLRVSFSDQNFTLGTVEFELMIDPNKKLTGSMHCRWQGKSGEESLAGFEFDSITKHDLAENEIFYELLS
ncbi:MAG: response regulator [Oligoflexus sp.]